MNTSIYPVTYSMTTNAIRAIVNRTFVVRS